MPIVACRVCGSIGFPPAFDPEAGLCPACRPAPIKSKAKPSGPAKKAASADAPSKGD